MLTEVEKRELAAEAMIATGLKIDIDDPAFLLVMLNQFALKVEREKTEKITAELTGKFEQKFHQEIDGFIDVANECLGKFQAATMALIEAIEQAKNAPQKKQPPQHPPAQSSEKKPAEKPLAVGFASSYHWLGYPLLFAVGFVFAALIFA